MGAGRLTCTAATPEAAPILCAWVAAGAVSAMGIGGSGWKECCPEGDSAVGPTGSSLPGCCAALNFRALQWLCC